MKLLHELVAGLAVAFVAAACASNPAPTPSPSPDQRPPSTAPVVPPITPAPAAIRGGAWAFSYAPGTYTYTIVTDAVVAPLTDTTQKRAAPTSPERASITVSADGAVQVISPQPGATGACDATAAALTRAQQLIPTLPAHVTGGESWSDSTTTDGCRGSVPATSHVVHTYTVLGDTVLTGANALHVHRDDVISATGEGAEGQHRVLISATGTGSAELFFDVSTGRFLGSDGVQNSTVDVNTSGRITRFAQRVSQRVALTSSP